MACTSTLKKKKEVGCTWPHSVQIRFTLLSKYQWRCLDRREVNFLLEIQETVHSKLSKSLYTVIQATFSGFENNPLYGKQDKTPQYVDVKNRELLKAVSID